MYKKQKKSWVKHLDFLLIDIFCLEIAFLLSFFIKVGDTLQITEATWNFYSRLAVLILLVDLCVVFFFEDRKSVV